MATLFQFHFEYVLISQNSQFGIKYYSLAPPFIQCDKKICDKNFWCSRTSDDSSCTQSCPFETHDCNSLQSNDSKQTLTNLENGTNNSNPKEGSTYKKEDWTTILIILGSLALLIFVILLILFCMGKLPCCNFERQISTMNEYM